MKQKLKTCEGCNHLKPLWSAKWKMCRDCFYRLNPIELKPRKKIQAVSEKKANQLSKYRESRDENKDYRIVYCEYFGYSKTDFIPCELTGQKAVDINHLDARGMGGTTRKENIYNLMAMTRELHTEFGDISELKDSLKILHKHFMKTRIPIFKHIPTAADIMDAADNIYLTNKI